MFTTSFKTVVLAYCAASGVDPKTASSRIFNDGKVIPAFLRGDRTLTLRRAEAGLAFLSEHWPEGVGWPEGVPRPTCCTASLSDPDRYGVHP